MDPSNGWTDKEKKETIYGLKNRGDNPLKDRALRPSHDDAFDVLQPKTELGLFLH